MSDKKRCPAKRMAVAVVFVFVQAWALSGAWAHVVGVFWPERPVLSIWAFVLSLLSIRVLTIKETVKL